MPTVIGIAIAAALLLLGPSISHAQTNQALGLTDAQAKDYWKNCFADNATIGTCSKTTPDGVITACTKDLLAIAGDKCVFTFPDKSRIEADPNVLLGSTRVNYDSSGQLVGRDNNALPATPGSGSLENGLGGKDCSINSFGDIGTCIAKGFSTLMGTIVGSIAAVLLVIASFMLWVVGGLFNWVVIKTVFEFGSYFGTSPGMLIAWGILRDIANILLLFGFIFMGLMKIIDSHNEFAGGKTIARLIIFAVLLNFSLFATQIIIDVSNSFASVFTTQAGLSGCSGNDEQGKEACANNGIAGQVIHMAGISSIWSPQGIGDFSNRPEKHAPVYVGLTLFVTITAVVLLAAAIMLIMRAVMLCLLMVLSPIGFAGMAIPPLQEFARSWWKQLLSNAFFAPVYLLLVLISLKIVEGLVGTDNGDSFALALINGGMNAPQVFVMFAVVIAFMVASLVVAKRMGAVGADFATQKAGGAVLGTYGFLGRRTVGAGANKIAHSIRSSDWGQANRGRANLLLSTLGVDKAREASWSPRTLATNLGKGAHLDFGKPNKTAAHGIHGIEEKAVKDRDKYFKDLELTDKQKGVATETQEELDEIKKKLDERRTEEREAVEEQRLKVAAARLKNDEALLKKEREILDQRVKEFDNKNKPSQQENEQAKKELEALLSRQSVLADRLKTWKVQGEKEKTDAYIENSLHGNWYPPGSIGTHADHVSVANIRKNEGRSKIERAIKDLQGALDTKEDTKDDTTTPPAH